MDYNRKGKTYAQFIKKVFNCPDGKRYGADQSLMIHLYLNELKEVGSKRAIPVERQFFKVKLYIEKALIKSKKKKKFIDASDFFSTQLLRLREAVDANDLMYVVTKSLSKIIELEHELTYRAKNHYEKVS